MKENENGEIYYEDVYRNKKYVPIELQDKQLHIKSFKFLTDAISTLNNLQSSSRPATASLKYALLARASLFLEVDYHFQHFLF